MLGDFGADVIKVEHPAGDNLRKLGWEKDGVSLWWALIGRNKRSVTLKLSDPKGAEAMKRLLATADVFIENFRTGTLERWGLGWDVLHELNPGLVMVRTTGFGQTGPYAQAPRLRHARRVDVGLRPHQRLPRRAADAAAVRARRRRRGADRRVRGDDRRCGGASTAAPAR